jgi:quinohemoprotein ethanol dehydrogenase
MRGKSMRRIAGFAGAVLAAAVLLAACSKQPAPPPVAAVDGARMRQAAADGADGQWMSYSRTWDEQRFSPLTQINDGNVSRLGLAWYDDLNTYRGVQATPLFVDGVLYNASVWNVVTAYEATTGRKLWTYDPKVDRQWARLACCGPTSRGIAIWNGKVYVAALDGRLIAVDARDGRELWSVQTIDPSQPYSITGAPRVYDGRVVIGNGGADYGVRGYVTAYDAETGSKLWRFYTVPGNPANGPDGEASDSVMEMATKTWNGEWWKYGGGGTAWDSFAFDPELNLVYIGTGNGSPHIQHFRSPGGGDNLFLCSIIAVRADTGEYVWHYQMVPEEQWDFTCTQPMILADLDIDGVKRKVIMQAPKNGFFYVLDRTSGKLISARTYVPNLWATEIDMETGRPKVNPGAYVTETPQLMTPTWMAAHSWHPMSYSPLTGLVYFPAQEQWVVQARVKDDEFRFVPFRSNTGNSFTADPERRRELQRIADSREKGYLLAWNPVTQSEAFRVPYKYPGSGGVLTTAGNLLIQGTIDRTLAIYKATDGSKLWEMDTQTVAIAGPMTFMANGEQYIAVNVGWGGSPVAGLSRENPPVRFGPARLLVFKLDAKGVTLPPMPPPPEIPAPPPLRASEAQVREGRRIFGETCSRCHGENAIGGLKDLRWMTPETRRNFATIVLESTPELREKGMQPFKDLLGQAEVEALNAYLVARANEDYQDHIAGAQIHPQ